MSINFPNSPTTGTTYNAPTGLTYRYDGEKWTTLGSSQVEDSIKVGDNISELNNDAGFITSSSLPIVPTNVSAFTNDSNYVASGDNISVLNNDSNFITAAQVPAAFVSGMILMWGGAVVDIPSGWSLCDGTNGTPDLRNRFIVGATDTYNVGDTGGSSTGTDTVNINVSGSYYGASKIGTQGDTSTSNKINLGTQQSPYNSNGSRMSVSTSYDPYYSTMQLNGMSFAGSDTVNVDTLPPYYALCFIIKD